MRWRIVLIEQSLESNRHISVACGVPIKALDSRNDRKLDEKCEGRNQQQFVAEGGAGPLNRNFCLSSHVFILRN